MTEVTIAEARAPVDAGFGDVAQAADVRDANVCDADVCYRVTCSNLYSR
jgi:hypothetical protein